MKYGIKRETTRPYDADSFRYLVMDEGETRYDEASHELAVERLRYLARRAEVESARAVVRAEGLRRSLAAEESLLRALAAEEGR